MRGERFFHFRRRVARSAAQADERVCGGGDGAGHGVSVSTVRIGTKDVRLGRDFFAGC